MVTTASAIGSMPGTSYGESLRVVLGELPDLPHVPELPARGPHADMTGRSLAIAADIGADLQPAGWRLTGSRGAAGVDHRRAVSLLAQDLDLVEELTQRFSGRLKIQVAGPWTLAAMVEKPRGDRVLSDRGARRELAQALAEGVGEHVADVRRRVPGAEILVQVDEPVLPAVLAGQVPTASGFHRHRSVDPPGVSPALEWVLGAIADSDATPIVHCCAADVPVPLLVGAGAAGVSVDLAVLEVSAYDAVADLLEKQRPVLLGIVPAIAPGTAPTETGLTEQVLRFLDMLGLDAGECPSLVVTPACGLAGATPEWAREALALTAKVAANLR